ncbi:hypothetical protein Avbf_15751 [Armadillidium vulgare]|nr:hypothetical protein Avbf_15751 [Armadillidium vulgare]
MKVYHECKKNLFNVNLFKSGMQLSPLHHSIWILPKFIIILTLETFFLLKVIKHRFDYQKQTNKMMMRFES